MIRSSNKMGLRSAGAILLLLAAISMGCGGGEELHPQVGGVNPKGNTANTTKIMQDVPVPDALGEKPKLSAPKTFTPTPPVVFSSLGGMSVWLNERHTLPMVSVMISIPSGSATDPSGKAGLSYITAAMLDEGAGKLGAVDLSSAINDLGANLSISTGQDGSYITLTVLKKNFEKAFSLLGDIVVRPKFDEKEWKRVSELWQNNLKKRADEPWAVSRVVGNAVHFGPGHPYAHPSMGLIKTAATITLKDAKAYYQAHYRPDRASVVFSGDISKDEADKAIQSAFEGWKAPKDKAPEVPAPKAIASNWKAPRFVLVDRPDAPQSVIAAVREGVVITDSNAPLLDLINIALGGSFTSRLNQNLREEHGWSYGARSSFSENRGQGYFVAGAAVQTEFTGPALKELLGELSKMAAKGLSEDEHLKVLAQDRGELVQTYESLSGMTSRLGTLSMLGLAPGFDAQASQARQASKMPALLELCKRVDPANATVVVVGPKSQVLPQMAGLALGEPEMWNAEGERVAPESAANPKK